MDDRDAPPDYVKGYNAGYTLAQHEPELAAQLLPSIGQSVYGTGFRSGYDQLQSEKNQSRFPSWLKSDRLTTDDNTKDQTKDKDAPDKD